MYYYEQTTTATQYGVAVLLDPVAKDRFWKEKHWVEDAKWEQDYWAELQDTFYHVYGRRIVERRKKQIHQIFGAKKEVTLDDLISSNYKEAEQEDPELSDIEVEFMEYRQFGKLDYIYSSTFIAARAN